MKRAVVLLLALLSAAAPAAAADMTVGGRIQRLTPGVADTDAAAVGQVNAVVLGLGQGPDVASAGTTSIGAVVGRNVNVTGSAAITGLGVAAVGVEKVVHFTGTPTLVYNATSLILPGGASISVQAGDYATCLSRGSGNWTCHDFNRIASAPTTGTNTGDQTITLTGPVTGSGTGSIATSIPAHQITLSMLATGVPGTLLAWDASGNPSAVAAGTSGQVLKSNGAAAPSWQAVGGGDALTTNPLSQFAATTSAQLFGVLSDETGGGKVVGSLNPGFTGYNLHTAIAAPSNPGAGLAACYVDSGSLNWVCQTTAGVKNHGLQTRAATSHQFLTGVADDGSSSAAQPAAADITGLAAVATSGSAADLSGTLAPARLPGLTGDVTAPSGSGTTALANIPSGVPAAGTILSTSVVAPATPAAGRVSLYTDSTSKNIAAKNDVGIVNHGIQTKPAVASNWIRSIADDGGSAASQPNFTDLAGALQLSQIATGTAGKVLVYDASGNPTSVGPGTSGQALVSNGPGTAPSFQTVSGGGGGDALTTNPLSQFASTTSAQLAGVLSDETGTSGGFVRAGGATLVAPVLGVASATTLNKLTLTPPAAGAVLTIDDGFILHASGNATVSGTNTGDQTITLTGPVTGSGTGSFATTLANVPDATPELGTTLRTAVVAPATPAAGKASVYVDSTSKALASKNDAGVVSHTVQTKAVVSHQFLTGVADDGTTTAAQPGTGDISGLAAVAASGSATDLTTGTLPAARLPGLSGDVTAPSGSGTTTLANIPTGVPAVGTILHTGIAAPSTPAAGKVLVYADSTSKALAAKNDVGVVSHTVQTKAATTSNWIRSIADDGTAAASQPAFPDISGTLPLTQMATGTAGKVLAYDASGNPSSVGPGTSGQALLSNGPGAVPTFQTLPGGGDALTTNPLSQFAATTSAQLAGVVSDETGTNKLVYSTNPVFDSYNTGSAIAAPASPGAGAARCWIDSTSLTWTCKNASAVVSHAVQTKAAVSHQFLTAVADDGTVAAAQPAAADVSGLAAIATSGSATDLITGTVSAAASPALTGDVTKTAGANSTVVANVPAGATVAGRLIDTAVVAPSTPGAGTGAVYVDSTSKNIAVKDDAGTVKHGVQTKTAVANNFATAVADDGTVTVAQPAFTNLSGSATAAQMPAFSGDVTTTAGSTVTALANIPTGTPAVGTILRSNIAAPSTPASGKVQTWSDSTDLRFHDKNSAGTIATTVVADTGAANNYVTAVSAAGVISKARPVIGDVTAFSSSSFLGQVTDESGTGVVIGSGSPTITTPTFSGGATISGGALHLGDNPVDATYHNDGNKTGSAVALADFSTTYNAHYLTLTGNVTSSTWTIGGAKHFELWVCQPATGGPFTLVWPTSPTLVWAGGSAPTLSTSANACDVASFTYNGTTLIGQAGGGGGGGGITAGTGDVTFSGSGSVATTNVNAPTGFTHAGTVVTTAIVAPSTPATGKAVQYVDSTSKNFASKDDAGVINHGIRTNTGTTNQWVSAVADNGAVTTTQPGVSNLASSTSAQLATVLSDETGTGVAVFNGNPTLAGATLTADLATGGNSVLATKDYGYTKFSNGSKGGASPALLTWSNGSWQGLTQNATITGTPTWTLPSISQNLRLDVCMDTTGGYSWIWPSGITWDGGVAPVPVNSANACTRFSFSYDGTTVVGSSSRIYLVAGNNLSDLPSASTARTNLGLGTAAVLGTAAAADAETGTSTSLLLTPAAAAAIWSKGADNAGGATITLGDGGSFNLITSTTAITAFAFTNDLAGRKAVVRFNTIRTLTYNATSLILPTAASITTAVGDIAWVESLGSGNFRVDSYTRADGTPLAGGAGGGITAGTGDVTFSGTGSVTTANVNAPTGFTHAGTVINTEIAAPSTPAASKVTTWADSTDARLHDKNPAGTIGTTVVADTGATNNFVTAVSAAGVISKAQPAFTNLSGSATAAQMPAGTGDVTWTAGTTTTTLANIPTGVPAVGTILHTSIVAPSTPAAGKVAIYADSTSKNIAAKNDAGTVNHGVQTRSAATSNWIRSIADDGSSTISQPAFTDVSGSATTAQLPTATNSQTIVGSSSTTVPTPASLSALFSSGTDNAGGATITLGDGRSFNLITSTTAITAFAFTDDVVGRQATIRFNTVRVLTYNATSLILPTAASITTAVGDIAVIESRGSGNFRVNHYTRADGTALAGSGGGITAGTGDVTFSGTGSVVVTNVNAPDGFTSAGKIVATEIAAPATPAAGKVNTWVDSTDARFHDKNPAGTIGTTVVADTGAANNFVTAVSAAGAISKAQPSFANLSGSATATQMPAGTGDVTWTAGSTTTTLANIPTTATQAGKITATNITAPATPSAGTAAIYVDSTSKNIAAKNDAGVVNHGVQTNTGTANQWVSAIADTGAVTTSQPGVSNLSSSTSAQLATVISDETGSGAAVFANTPTLVTPVLGGASATSIAMGNGPLTAVKTIGYNGVFDNGNEGGAAPALLTWASGNSQKLTLTSSITGTPTWTLPATTQYLQLDVCQNGTGGFTMTWPAVTWMNTGNTAPVLLAAASACTRVSLRYDGTTVTGTSATYYAQNADNLQFLGSASTARTNLGLGSAATASGKTLLGCTTITSGTSRAKTANTTFATVNIVAPGGGGGGCVAGSATLACAAGGGSSGDYVYYQTSTIPATWTYTFGSAGTAGTTSGSVGGTAGDVTFSDGTTTVTAKGGIGGAGMATDLGIAFITLGGAPPAISTNGTINGSGAEGGYGYSTAAGVAAHSGSGAATLFGSGGLGKTTNSAGGNAVGPGGGGGGAFSFGTSAPAAAGGVGGSPFVLLCEYQ